MAVEYVRPVSYSALLARRIALFALMLALAAWLATRFGPLVEPHFLALYLVACGLAALALLGAFIGLVNLWRIGAKGGKSSVAAVFLSIPVLLPAAYAGWLYRSHAAIYEVTTDLADPPKWLKPVTYDQSWLGWRPAPDVSMRETQDFAYPGLITHRYDAAIDRVVKAVRAAAAERHIAFAADSMPASLRDSEEEEATPPEVPGAIPVPRRRPNFVPGEAPVEQAVPVASFQGMVSDRLTGFPYDVVVRVREAGDSTLADIRVSARYGRVDLGISATLADAFLKALDDQMLGTAGE
jgi:hypothetical protein